MSSKDQKIRQRIAKSQGGLELQAWTSYKENSLELEYYVQGSVIPENPSGDKNVRVVKYYKADELIITKTITYDIDNDIITVKTT